MFAKSGLVFLAGKVFQRKVCLTGTSLTFVPRSGEKRGNAFSNFKSPTLAGVDEPKYQDGLREVMQWTAYT
ncbi:hypothetical protein DTL21_12870 [Bremerella cremea]|uniref:Uncharacterized protein n=1 Tax=Blastopirellula marina TaxID=124 RepID=A0A2S8FQE8_9BACT|nr:hypothetical protein C5Y83_12865 [Blastopirellula marina]RCS46909.1 hypothetical protein DTL21_12870 [Bremerella cremea]